jgi:regulatory protein
MMGYKTKLGAEQAQQRIKQYCAYQERCHHETKEKLFSFGLSRNEVDQIISALIEEDYLNEERFASAFARGKFRMKQWGLVKIKYELKQRHVSEYCIKKAMKEIDSDEYLKTFSKLFDTKMNELKSEKNVGVRKKKVTEYLLQKGFELDMILSHF